MNWITTNIRFPEDLYLELKMEAAQRRKSVAAIVRERIQTRRAYSEEKKKDILAELDAFAKKNAKTFKGINFTRALREMRYSQ